MSELVHWGIHGMKWGVRRFRNPDGTLTDEGKRRYGHYDDDDDDEYDDDDYTPRRSAKENPASGRESEHIVRKDPKDMDDAELRQQINRLQMERQYKDLTSDDYEFRNQVNRLQAERQMRDLISDDAKLRDIVNRMNLERQFKTLSREEMDKGKSKTDKLIDRMKKLSTILATGIAIKKSLDIIKSYRKKDNTSQASA